MKNGKKNSLKIGSFVSDKNGVMHGKIFGLGFGVTPVVLEPQTSRDGNGYFRLIADPVGEAFEIGVAFPRQKDGMNFHSVSIDSPALPGPIHGALFPDKDGSMSNLIWSRQDEARELRSDAVAQGDVAPQKLARGYTQRSVELAP